MKITYNPNLATTIMESVLIPTTADNALLYINRDEDYLTVEVEYKDNVLLLSQIDDVVETKKKYTVYTNTTNILCTDISVNGVEYYYKIVSLTGQSITKQDVLLNSTYDCIEVNGVLYTNDKIVNVKVNDTYIHSVHVIKPDYSISYLNKNIKIEIDRTDDRKLYFKPESDFLISYTVINDSKIYINPFYYNNGVQLCRCIEGDILLVEKEELIKFVGNKIQVKDLIHKYDNFYNHISNSIYTPKTTFSESTASVSYIAKISDHVFPLTDISYYKITTEGLTTGSDTDYDFIIKRKIDTSKLNVYLNEYLTTYQTKLRPSEYVLTSDFNVSSNDIVSFKNKIQSNLSKAPSEVVYITTDDTNIYQNKNSIDTDSIPVEVDEYTELKYDFTTYDYLETKQEIKIVDNVLYYR